MRARAPLHVVAPLALLGAVAWLSPAQAEDQVPTPQALAIPPIQGSISCGSANRGALSYGAIMPHRGTSWTVPRTWARRGYSFGTDELIGVIRRSADAVNTAYPGSILGVADLSKATGGAIPHHRSHQSGRDADLLFYAVDGNGTFMAPDDLMPIYRRSGKATYSKAPRWNPRIPVRYFDMERNWALVKALITDPHATVTNIFVARRIRTWLLRYAKESGEPKSLIIKAAKIINVPRNSSSHDDHMHIRVACSAEDIRAGRCKNHLARSKRKKRRKFYSRVRCPRPSPVAER